MSKVEIGNKNKCIVCGKIIENEEFEYTELFLMVCLECFDKAEEEFKTLACS